MHAVYFDIHIYHPNYNNKCHFTTCVKRVIFSINDRLRSYNSDIVMFRIRSRGMFCFVGFFIFKKKNRLE